MKKKPNRIMLKIFKLQLWMTVVFFLAYVISVAIGAEGTFLSDMQNKKRVAGTAVSAMLRIFGPPEKPVVLANATCNNAGFSAINLNWADAVDATSYDVYRDGELVANDLVDNFFVDESVSNSSSYTYYVIARGPAGEATSEEEAVLTKGCKPIVLPFISFSAFEGKNINGVLTTNNRRPLFQGQTNIPFAKVELEIHSDLVVYATTQTNVNGHWQWTPPVNISYGLHTLYIRVIDPNDTGRVASASLAFEIVEEIVEEDKKVDKKEIDSDAGSPLAQNIAKSSIQKDEIPKPFDLDISLENEAYIKGVSVAGEAYRGENLKTLIEFDGVGATHNNPIDISYIIIDSSEGNIIAQYSQQVALEEGLRVEKIIPLPQNLKLGKYKLRVNATIHNITVSNESMFILKDKPLLKIGATAYMTYPDLIDNLSWLFIVSTVFLAFFSLLALWEHHLYKQGLFHITEKVLKRKGFIN